MAAVKELQRDLENKANDLNKLPLSSELDLLNVDANVFKLIGTVLVKQDMAEANANVRKRMITFQLNYFQVTAENSIFAGW